MPVLPSSSKSFPEMAVHLPIQLGIFSVRLLVASLKLAMLVMLPSCVGRVPVIEFVVASTLLSSVSLPISEGIVPPMLLDLNLNSEIPVRKPISVGKLPPCPAVWTINELVSIFPTVVPEIVSPYQLASLQASPDIQFSFQDQFGPFVEW